MNPKDEFISLLRSTERAGVDAVVAYLDKAGFFTAPASVNRHLSHDGGLLEHSLNVYRTAVRIAGQKVALRPDIEKRLPSESVTLAALLHDVCKANIYRKVTKYRKDANNRWETYDGYEADYSRFPLGHGEKSVVMLLRLGKVHQRQEYRKGKVSHSKYETPIGALNVTFRTYECDVQLCEGVGTIHLGYDVDLEGVGSNYTQLTITVQEDNCNGNEGIIETGHC